LIYQLKNKGELMEKFNRLDGVAAPLNIVNIDTDMIIPKQFLKTIKRTGLGKSLFYEMRVCIEQEGLPQRADPRGW
jgi:3-isopropylmalate/(R)-2-methylmalate dehydratase small subunit